MDSNKILKWISAVITITAALTISLRITDISISYLLFLVGHSIMVVIFAKNRDSSLLFMNLVWVVVDIIGIIKWSY
jgi:nicotinamide riboside transporter PnuC